MKEIYTVFKVICLSIITASFVIMVLFPNQSCLFIDKIIHKTEPAFDCSWRIPSSVTVKYHPDFGYIVSHDQVIDGAIYSNYLSKSPNGEYKFQQPYRTSFFKDTCELKKALNQAVDLPIPYNEFREPLLFVRVFKMSDSLIDTVPYVSIDTSSIMLYEYNKKGSN